MVLGGREAGAPAGRVVEHVDAVAPHHAQQHAPVMAARDHHLVVAPVEVDADLIGRPGLEAAVDIRLARRLVPGGAGRTLSSRSPLSRAPGGDELVDIGAEDVHILVDVFVEAPRLVGQAVAPALQARDQARAVLRVELRGLAPRRAVDDLVGQLRLQLLRHLLPAGHSTPARIRLSTSQPS
jgi:hypothetical protein